MVPANARKRMLPRRALVLASAATPSRTQRIMEAISLAGQGAGGAGGSYSYDALKRLDKLWLSICSSSPDNFKPNEVVKRPDGSLWYSNEDKETTDKFDVLVRGGTLGVFIATTLSLKDLKVRIIERNLVKGREQEWNISEKELHELVEAGILLENDIEQVTVAKFNPNRCGFEGKGDIWVEDILKLGVSPVKLIEVVKQRFIDSGGTIYEGSSITTMSVYDDAVVINFTEEEFLSARLLIDAMGNFSPIVKQVRSGKKPDGACLVVGYCCRGFKNNKTSDVIFSSSSIKTIGKSKLQYFWEAFPAGSGPTDRTTYMFTYLDPRPGCPTLEHLLEDFWDLMPNYQGVDINDIEILSHFSDFSYLSGQDVVQFWPLTKTLGTIVLSQPQILPSIFNQSYALPLVVLDGMEESNTMPSQLPVFMLGDEATRANPVGWSHQTFPTTRVRPPEKVHVC